jgi:hypothetical protein
MVCGVSAGPLSVSAHDYENNDRASYGFMGWRSLADEINHLNRMRGQVRWQLGNYRGGWKLRREFARVSAEIDHINSQFKNEPASRRSLRHEVERVHTELHGIETELHVKPRDYYRWR